jgi:hypothetical protein
MLFPAARKVDILIHIVKEPDGASVETIPLIQRHFLCVV